MMISLLLYMDFYEYSKPGFEPGTKRLDRALLFPLSYLANANILS